MRTTNRSKDGSAIAKHMVKIRSKQMTAILLSLVFVLSLLPSTVFADNAELRFQDLINPGQPNNYSESLQNPYGYSAGQKFMLSEQNELLLYYSYDSKANTQNRYSFVYDTYQKKGSMTLTNDANGWKSKTQMNANAFGYTAAIGFDPNGTGRKDHVAYIGYANQDDDPKQGYVLWVLNTVTGEQTDPVRVSVTTCNWLQKQNADLYAGSNFFNIVAGDFDGDGKDDLVLSIVDNNNSYGLAQYRYVNQKLERIDSDRKDLLHPLYTSLVSQFDFGDKGGSAKDKLAMDLAVGDFNGDGIDDLAVLSYPNKGCQINKSKKTNDVRFGQPYLAVSYGSESGGSILRKQTDGTYISAKGNGDLEGLACTSMCTAIAAGDIDADGKDEILTAGYVAVSEVKDGKIKYLPFNNGITSWWLYASFLMNGTSLTQIETQVLNTNVWSNQDSGMDDNVAPKVSLETVAIDGKANPERIFLSGDMFKCLSGTNQLLIQDPNTPSSQKESPVTLNYFTEHESRVNGKDVGKSYIASTAVGNFEETKEGYEQIAYVVGLQSKGLSHVYSFSVHIAGGDTYQDGAAVNYYQISGSYVMSNKEFGLDKRPNCLVVSIDMDKDGIVASYRGVSYAWSDPQVQAILQASPYFAELHDGANDSDYLNDEPETAYSTSVTYSYETSKSNSVSFGAGFAGEISGKVGPQIELQAGYAMDWCESFTKTLETSVTNTFTAGRTDAVIVYRTPVFVYAYDIVYQDNQGNLQSDVLQISVPKAPRYKSLSVERYNEFVDYYNGLLKAAAEKKGISGAENEPSYLQKLADNLYLGNEGNPYGYYQSSAPEGLERFGKLVNLSANGGGSNIEYSYSESDSQTREIAHGFTFDLTITAGFDIGAVSARAGGYVSLQYMKGKSVTKTNGVGTTFSGTVMDLVGKDMIADGLDPDAWGFTWQLGRWDSNLTDNSENSTGKVPVVGYLLTDIQSPPMPVEDLKLKYAGKNADDDVSFQLSWRCGDIIGSDRPLTAGYRIYLLDPVSETYQLIEEIADAETSSFDYQIYHDGRVSYDFIVKAYSEASVSAPAAESVGRRKSYFFEGGQDGKDGEDGIGIIDIKIDENGCLIFLMSDGDRINAGSIAENPAMRALIAEIIQEILAGGTGVESNPFTDVQVEDWFYRDVIYVYQKGLMRGTSDKTFDPDGVVNRAMLVTTLWRLEGSPATGASNQFTDTPTGQWYSEAVSWAAEHRIVLGYGNGLFGPTDAVTREQVMAILHRYAEYKGLRGTSGHTTSLNQTGTYGFWAKADIEWADRYGMFYGVGAEVSDLRRDADRAELAAYLKRFCESFDK